VYRTIRSQLESALAAIARMRNEWIGVEVLAALAPRLPAHLHARALQVPDAYDSRPLRLRAFGALLPHLAPPLRGQALAQMG
jgi:hypothetical protein